MISAGFGTSGAFGAAGGFAASRAASTSRAEVGTFTPRLTVLSPTVGTWVFFDLPQGVADVDAGVASCCCLGAAKGNG